MPITVDTVLADPVKIVLAVVLVELITLTLVREHIAGKVVVEWYEKFRLGAFVSDVASMTFGVFLALCLFKYVFPREWFTLPHFLVCVVAIQVTHDALFSVLLRHVPVKKNAMMEMLSRYVGENGWKILLVDAVMMMGCVLMLYLLLPVQSPLIWFGLAFALYLAQYLIFA